MGPSSTYCWLRIYVGHNCYAEANVKTHDLFDASYIKLQCRLYQNKTCIPGVSYELGLPLSTGAHMQLQHTQPVHGVSHCVCGT